MSDLFKPVDGVTVPDTVSFEDLVGDDKRFKDANELAKAKIASDAFIEQLKREAAELRKELGSKATVDEIMTQIRGLSKSVEPQPPVTPPVTPQNDSTNIQSIVAEMFSKTEAERRIAANKAKVEETLIKKYGADAALHVSTKAKELNVPLAFL